MGKIPQRTLDKPEVLRHIAEMQAAGTSKRAQISMARLALRFGKYTPEGHKAYEELLSSLEEGKSS